VSYRNDAPTRTKDVCYAIRRSGRAPGQAYTTPARSILPPADARAAIVVVGAVPAAAPDRIEPFSSRGPTFDGRPRPHVVAIDRLAVSGAGGFASPFPGTSAAAGYLGGAAARVDVPRAFVAGALGSLLGACT
jgi:hypothetical protein